MADKVVHYKNIIKKKDLEKYTKKEIKEAKIIAVLVTLRILIVLLAFVVTTNFTPSKHRWVAIMDSIIIVVVIISFFIIFTLKERLNKNIQNRLNIQKTDI